MAFILECLDKPGALDTRLANRPAHLAYVEANVAKVLIAGPILTEEGSPVGSLLVLDMETRAEVEAFAAADPYAKAGVFGSTTIRPFKKVFPAA